MSTQGQYTHAPLSLFLVAASFLVPERIMLGTQEMLIVNVPEINMLANHANIC